MATAALTENCNYINTTKVSVSYTNRIRGGKKTTFKNAVRFNFHEEPVGSILYISRPDENGDITISKVCKPNTVQTAVTAYKSNENKKLQSYLNFRNVVDNPCVYDMFKVNDEYVLKLSDKPINPTIIPDFVVGNDFHVRLGLKNVQALKRERTNLYWKIEEHYKPYTFIRLQLVEEEELPENYKKVNQAIKGLTSENINTESVVYYRKRTGCVFLITRLFQQAANIRIGQRLDIFLDEANDSIIIQPEEKTCDVCGKKYNSRTTKMRKIHYCGGCDAYFKKASDMAKKSNGNLSAVKSELQTILNTLKEI